MKNDLRTKVALQNDLRAANGRLHRAELTIDARDNTIAILRETIETVRDRILNKSKRISDLEDTIFFLLKEGKRK